MSDTSEPLVDLRPTSPEAVELWCTECGYNLTGTVEDRCSECGREFDRAVLIEWTTGRQQRLPLGSLSQPGDNTFWLSLFKPARLGWLLPPHPDTAAVKTYSLVVRILAAVGVPLVLTSIMAIPAGEKEFFYVLFLIPLPLLIPSLACELLIAALLARFVEPRSVPRPDWYPFWRTLCRLLTSYLLITVSLVCLAIGLADVIIGRILTPPSLGLRIILRIATTLPFWGPIGMVLWWWYSLGQAIAARGAACAARTVIILLLPAIALAAIALGLGITMLEVYVVAWLF